MVIINNFTSGYHNGWTFINTNQINNAYSLTFAETGDKIVAHGPKGEEIKLKKLICSNIIKVDKIINKYVKDESGESKDYEILAIQIEYTGNPPPITPSPIQQFRRYNGEDKSPDRLDPGLPSR